MLGGKLCFSGIWYNINLFATQFLSQSEFSDKHIKHDFNCNFLTHLPTYLYLVNCYEGSEVICSKCFCEHVLVYFTSFLKKFFCQYPFIFR